MRIKKRHIIEIMQVIQIIDDNSDEVNEDYAYNIDNSDNIDSRDNSDDRDRRALGGLVKFWIGSSLSIMTSKTQTAPSSGSREFSTTFLIKS